MAAQTLDEEEKKRRRKRLIKGLALGGAAVGVPALVNALVSHQAKRLPAATWGSGDRYPWKQGRVVFQHLGEGDPLLLVHSFGPGHSGREWRRTAERLAQNYRVYALDLLGWGQSDKPSIPYDAALYIELLRDFLDNVIGDRATIVAAGLPAAYAVRLAAEEPALVRALGLVVPGGVETHERTPEARDAMIGRLLKLPLLGTSAMNLYTSRSAIYGYLRREVYASPSVVDDDAVEEHYRLSHLPGAHEVLIAYVTGQLNHSVRDALERLEVPVWLAWGRRAMNPPVETADLWLRHLPDAELDVLEQCGVLPHAESPEEFRRKLEQFLIHLDS